jgi:hypothetical protein
MEWNFQATRANADDTRLLELKHNISKATLKKVHAIWDVNVAYRRTIYATWKEIGNGTFDLTSEKQKVLFCYNHLKFWATDKFEDDPSLTMAFMDMCANNGTVRLWGTDNSTTFYRRLYNQTLGNSFRCILCSFFL